MATILESDLDKKLQQLADRMIASFETNDGDAYRRMFAPGAVVWLSYMNGSMTADENADLLGQLHDAFVRQLKYDDIQQRRTADGWVQRHLLTAVAKNGDALSIGACAIVHLNDDGLISRIDEYIDSKMVQFGNDHQADPLPSSSARP